MDKDDLIGESIIGLPQFDFTLDPVYTGWYTLKAQVNTNGNGRLNLRPTDRFI